LRRENSGERLVCDLEESEVNFCPEESIVTDKSSDKVNNLPARDGSMLLSDIMGKIGRTSIPDFEEKSTGRSLNAKSTKDI
jgi:hypothetical protein